MFDIGFSEIVVIFGLALVVLGPDKLPRIAQTVGRWAGRARAMARQFRDQLEQEANQIKTSVDMNAPSAPPPAPAPAAPATATPATAAPTPPVAPAEVPPPGAAPSPTDAPAAPAATTFVESPTPPGEGTHREP